MNYKELYASFADLPIVFEEDETNEKGWRRKTKRLGSVRELLKIWDIDDPHEQSEMAQVLRHLKQCYNIIPDWSDDEWATARASVALKKIARDD
jgi:hypothetical protein